MSILLWCTFFSHTFCLFRVAITVPQPRWVPRRCRAYLHKLLAIQRGR